LGALSVSLGILALVLAIIPVGLTQLVGVAAGLVAVLLGVLGRSRAAEAGKPTRSGTAGMALGSLGVVFSGIFFAGFLYIMDRVGQEVEGSSAGVKMKLGKELVQEFGRERGTAEFHKALKKVLDRAEKEGKVK
jgi:hypothetical protein